MITDFYQFNETEIQVDKDLTFATINERKLKLDLYRPKNQKEKLPVIVWIFGGAFLVDTKEAQKFRATWLPQHGYAVAVISHRLSGEAQFPAQVHDSKAAIRWLRANAASYNLDIERFGAWGSSSGGYLSTMLGVTAGVNALEGTLGNNGESSRVQAVVDFWGPTDFFKMDEMRLPDGQWHYPVDSPESRLLGASILDVPDKVREANPITYVNGSAPPFLIIHGTEDLLVPVNQSELLFEALRGVGVDAAFFKLVGAGHGGPDFFYEDALTKNSFLKPVFRGMVLEFFNQHLKKIK